VELGELFRLSPFEDDFPLKGDAGTRDIFAPSRTVSKWMSKFVKGQNEAVRAFVDLEDSKAFFGKEKTTTENSQPDVIVLMGIPGNGKDTLAETYVNAMWSTEAKYNSTAKNKHIYTISPLVSEPDSNYLFGSRAGYVGSNEIPPFLRWLVEHSGGKSLMVENPDAGSGETKEYIVLNPDWDSKKFKSRKYKPEKAVILINEFHDWSRIMKNRVLKEALNKGYFPVGNAGGGVDRLEVPVTFVVATNDGVSLLVDRNADGSRFGPPQEYDEILSRWEGVHENKQLLKDHLKRGPPARGVVDKGTSEEVVNRLPDQNIILLRPLSPMSLRDIARHKLSILNSKFRTAETKFRKFRFMWTENLIQFLQEYDFVAEENARPIPAKVTAFIEKTIIEAVKNQRITLKTPVVEVDIVANSNGSHSLVLKPFKIVKRRGGRKRARSVQKVQVEIRATKGNLAPRKMSHKEVAKLMELKSILKKEVFGIEPVVDRLVHTIIDAQNNLQQLGKGIVDPRTNTTKANTFLFLGWSSTGKTETAKALARHLYKGRKSATEKEPKRLLSKSMGDFATAEEFEKWLHGERVGDAAKPSEFMQFYDRFQGRFILLLDELSNAKPGVAKKMYDLVNEANLTGFSDQTDRAMAGVTIIMTGNATEEWFKGIPKDVPFMEKEKAWREIYKRNTNNPDVLFQTLTRYFPEPFINRILDKTIVFPSLSPKAVRQLADLKLRKALKKIGATEKRLGWQVVFHKESDYIDLVHAIERNGFTLEAQGRSIEHYIDHHLVEGLKALLRDKAVKDGTQVVLEKRVDSQSTLFRKGATVYHVWVEGRTKPYILALPKQPLKDFVDKFLKLYLIYLW